MVSILIAIPHAVLALVRPRATLALEVLALRQQLAVLRRSTPRPRLRLVDRAFWVVLSRLWSGWRRVLVLVEPATVVRWHRAGFRLFWRWKSRPHGRPPKGRELRHLVREMALANPTWGAPRIHGELLKLGFEVAESTVARYMPRRLRSAPSPTWRTFIDTHLGQSVGIDFFTIPTAAFKLLYGFVVIGHLRRRLLHVDVTDHPTATWTAQRIVETFPYDSAPRFLFRDRDSIYGQEVRARLKGMGVTEVLSAPRSPWQNPFAERVIGSIRRELLDHVIVLNESHARRLLHAYQTYYNRSRTHLSLLKDSPDGREVQAVAAGTRVVAMPEVGGLHRRYERRAA